jgi:hypothetical protein
LLSDARILAAYLIFVGSDVVFAPGKFPGMKIDRPCGKLAFSIGYSGEATQ